jgi:hypothetical protein
MKMLLDVDGVLLLLVVLVVVMMIMIIVIVITTTKAVASIIITSATSMQVSLLTKFHIFSHYYVFFKLKVLMLFRT